jgi:hypothetical protein
MLAVEDGLYGRLYLLSFRHSRHTKRKPLRLITVAQLGPVAQICRFPLLEGTCRQEYHRTADAPDSALEVIS